MPCVISDWYVDTGGLPADCQTSSCQDYPRNTRRSGSAADTHQGLAGDEDNGAWRRGGQRPGGRSAEGAPGGRFGGADPHTHPPELMVRTLYKEVEVLAHSGSRVGSDLPAKGFPARPCTAIPVLLPDGAVGAAREGVDVISGV